MELFTRVPRLIGKDRARPLTTVVYNPRTGEIYNADMAPLAVRELVAPDAYDFASVVTREAGFLGIAYSDVPGIDDVSLLAHTTAVHVKFDALRVNQ